MNKAEAMDLLEGSVDNFKRLADLHHPDHGGDPRIMALLVDARNALLERSAYVDRGLDLFVRTFAQQFTASDVDSDLIGKTKIALAQELQRVDAAREHRKKHAEKARAAVKRLSTSRESDPLVRYLANEQAEAEARCLQLEETIADLRSAARICDEYSYESNKRSYSWVCTGNSVF